MTMAHTYTFIDADGLRAHYQDRKRGWWALSMVYPLMPRRGVLVEE